MVGSYTHFLITSESTSSSPPLVILTLFHLLFYFSFSFVGMANCYVIYFEPAEYIISINPIKRYQELALQNCTRCGSYHFFPLYFRNVRRLYYQQFGVLVQGLVRPYVSFRFSVTMFEYQIVI